MFVGGRMKDDLWFVLCEGVGYMIEVTDVTNNESNIG
jgi:hypothetical protein